MMPMTMRKKPPTADVPTSFDVRTDPRWQEAHRKLGELHGRQQQIEHGSDAQAQEIADVTRELDALEVKRVLGDVSDAELESLRSRRRRLDDERRDLLDEVPRLGLAIAEQERRLTVLEGEIQQELRPQLEAEIRAAVEDLASSLRVVAEKNERLRRVIAPAAGGYTPRVSYLPSLVLVDSDHGDVYLRTPFGQSDISRWFREARAAGFTV